ncbi:MaoC family dehydratase N-terminal domain-containing protein [Rhodococcus sp. ARC_M6]|uniref:MaoC family dehydratase N-terminal domain-containing protein n=1 Tax=Rhodococcus sp. ARC_M6 TaxID=2928852 RepID=UPI001FB24190|nr:MaoC family dehydratase N-terminal domain-containing protein [Rhodococcus sp. ARC_M6]MCJ0907287.1 MaoC family dehydratase N-terminal domain-containing protein [Rhodococcus sp. ARC_M6]
MSIGHTGLDPAVIGTQIPATSLTVDAGRLRFFAKAIGEDNPVYTDLDSATAAGHPDLPVPPTFLFSIELEQPDPFAWAIDLGVDLRHVLHGEQSFTYHSTAFAGDVLTARPRISDVYAKKGGSMQFIVKETAVTRDDGSAVADLTSVIVVRNPEAGR